jgi:hypothetical protein
MKLEVYHGSYIEIKEIDLSKARPGKDFGKGFYVTNDEESAKRMARRQGKWNNCGDGIVSKFEFDYDEAFNNTNGRYKTLQFDGYTREWLDFIIFNRYKKEPHDYDIIEGPIADDYVVQRVDELKDEPKEAEKDKLLEDLTFSGTSHQICFCKSKALNTIKRIGLLPHREIRKMGISIVKYLVKNNRIQEQTARSLYYNSEICKKLSDESTGLYKKTWQEIYDMLKAEKTV